MSIGGVYFVMVDAVGGGDNTSVSISVRFDPQSAFAQTALTFANLAPSFGSHAGIGISHYETRPDPNGPSQPTDFSLDSTFSYPPCVIADQMTVVTAELFVGAFSWAAGQMTVYLFD